VVSRSNSPATRGTEPRDVSELLHVPLPESSFWLRCSIAVPAARAETPASDPKAVEIADQVMTSLGGKEKWGALPGVRWTFGVSVGDTVRPGARHHSWNMHTMWHRVEGTNRAGLKYVYIENLSDSTGMAWVNGNKIEGDSLKKLMRFAHAVWINDSYWFLMPYKLRDAGVTLKYDSEVKDSTGTWDKLSLSFENVGMTPGDHYWVYVNRANHRIERWDHQLQGTQPPPTPWTLEAWEQHEGLWFATAHKNGTRTVFTNAVEAVKAFPPTEFTAP
jgi:hypothetical protein